MTRALVLSLLVGCTWVADAQYDDRASELEEAREELLPGEAHVRFLTAAENRVFWATSEKPLDQLLLHSLDPVTGQRIDYAWSRGETDLVDDYRYGGQIIADCSSSQVKIYDATVPDRLIEMTTMGSSLCAVDAREVYFRNGREVRRWTPGSGTPPTKVVDLDAAMVGTGTIDGFAALRRQLLLSEGGRLWRIDMNTGKATWLENEDKPAGTITFDERGVLFDSSRGIEYVAFADHAMFSFEDAVRDGGYYLNSAHADLELADSAAEAQLFGDHVVYRGARGIFAYSFATGKVTDLLLDRGQGSDATTRYRYPAVTPDGTLFVRDRNYTDNEDKPVYRLDLNARLR